MTVSLAGFTIAFDAHCSVRQLWDRMMCPELHSGWMDATDGIETQHFEADIREGGHVISGFRIGGGQAMRMDMHLLRLYAPSTASVSMNMSYDNRLAIASLVRLTMLPRGICGSRLIHTEMAHFLNGGEEPNHHRDFMEWWYSVAFRPVAAAYCGASV